MRQDIMINGKDQSSNERFAAWQFRKEWTGLWIGLWILTLHLWVTLFCQGSSGGTVSAVLLGEKQIKIKSKSQGQLIKVLVDEGTSVKSGAVLAKLEDRQEVIERNLASVEYKIAEEDFQKTQSLKKYVSEEEISKKKNEVIRKKSVFELKDLNLSHKDIVAPIDGVVSRKYFTVGETVAAGDVVYDIVQLQDLVMELYLEVKDGTKISKGNLIKFKTDYHRDQEFSATVVYVSPVVDSASGTLRVRASVKNRNLPDGSFALKPGTLATVQFEE